MARPKKSKPNRADGLYEKKVVIGHTIDGKPIRKSFYSSKSIEDAQRKGNEYIVKMALSGQTADEEVAKKYTFNDVAERVLEIASKRVRASTLERYKYIYRSFSEYFGERKIQTIKPDDITSFFIAASSNYSSATLANYRHFAKKVFEYAVENEIIKKNPVISTKTNGFGKKPKQRRIYTKEQLDLIIDYCETHPCAIALCVDIMARYGTSRSETLGLQHSDLDREKKTLKIQRSRTIQGHETTNTDTKNKFRQREIPISQKLIDLIDVVCCENETHIISKNSKPYSVNSFENDYKTFMAIMVLEIKDEKGIEIPILTCHEFRHSRASVWVNEGKNVYAIIKTFGWSGSKMLFKTYGHPDMEGIRELLDIDGEKN